MKRLYIFCFIIVLELSFFLLGSQSGSAQETSSNNEFKLEEIVVTAEKRETSLQKTAASIGAVDGSAMDEAGLISLFDVASDMANVFIASSPNGFNATIRGVGQEPIPADIGGSAGVSSLFDGVYNMMESSAAVGFYDVARFELLRGPQGTLYGRNAEGGMFNIITNDPTQKVEGSATAEVGNYNLKRITGMFNAPINEKLAVRLAAAYVDRDGYLSNGQFDNVARGARLKVLYTPTESARLLFGAEYTHTGGKGAGGVTPSTYPLSDPWHSDNPKDQFTKNSDYKLWANLDFNLRFGDLTLLPAYQHAGPEKHVINNGAQSDSGAQPKKLVQRSIEMRMTSLPGSPISWIAGAYFYDYDLSRRQIKNIVVDGVIVDNPTDFWRDSYQASSSKAVYAQVTVPLGNAFRLIGGAREGKDKTSVEVVYDAGGGAGNYPYTEGEWSRFDWKVGFEYDLTEASLFYGSISTGYRPGGFDPQKGDNFVSEELIAYEIGYKNELLDHRLRLNASAFYYDYTDYQALTFKFDPPFYVNLDIVNARDAYMYGAELGLTWLATPDDLLTVNLGDLESKVTSSCMVTNPDGHLPWDLLDIKGNTFPKSPEWTASISYRHTFWIGSDGASISAEPSLRYSSSYHIVPAVSKTSNADAYVKYDAVLNYVSASNKWGASLYGHNISNKAIKSEFLAPQCLMLQAPRTFGATFNINF
jgi:iron complex outermembrane recepter protein